MTSTEFPVNDLEVYLTGRAITFGRDHKGMPRWPVIVDRIRILLTQPDHPAWRDVGRAEQAHADKPRRAPSPDELTAILLTRPSALDVDVLEWLSDYFLYCAGPPYSVFAWNG